MLEHARPDQRATSQRCPLSDGLPSRSTPLMHSLLSTGRLSEVDASRLVLFRGLPGYLRGCVEIRPLGPHIEGAADCS